MGKLVKNNEIAIWGKVTRDATFSTTKSGKHFSAFNVNYDYHANEDGQYITESIGVNVWGDLAVHCGDPQCGIAKGDTVFVCGKLVRDDYYRDGEDKSKPKYKIVAELVIDATSMFQLAQMVVTGEGVFSASEEKKPPKYVKERGNISPSGFEDVEEDDDDDPFSGDGELPY